MGRLHASLIRYDIKIPKARIESGPLVLYVSLEIQASRRYDVIMTIKQHLVQAAKYREAALLREIETKHNELLELVADRCEIDFLKEDQILFSVENENKAYGQQARNKSWTARGLRDVFELVHADIGAAVYADKLSVKAHLKTDIDVPSTAWNSYVRR